MREVRSAVRPFYNSVIRPVLPKKVGELNGVFIPDFKFGDGVITERQVYNPEYEDALVSEVVDVVEEGDCVSVVGGGRRAPL